MTSNPAFVILERRLRSEARCGQTHVARSWSAARGWSSDARHSCACCHATAPRPPPSRARTTAHAHALSDTRPFSAHNH
ncbi:unnamed protein product [Arctia plantaginis]|uniref:Uncharacterized protein n=1 Tax=Arctia plantaginis TaxID=874455 RepID=A0A8S0Z7S3_ARCPL|nr:unnamed protein product [Arctia plantaginis]